ncbi:hypothetical protein L873DRAFT_121196 [Choiromyces venosus 120613-1]|uniref:Uncharacterized protein n=1 Tax=Choiromyces venosus 120613-1 TaxID=1336337 RepID=A0A3N4J3X8_9PEZI|nr:hypothetical protein L873DRAFT_121196 [Choiromyces venosus 120613-1]
MIFRKNNNKVYLFLCWSSPLPSPAHMGKFLFYSILFYFLLWWSIVAPHRLVPCPITSLLFACSCISINASKAGSKAMHCPYLEHAVLAVTFPFTDLCSMLHSKLCPKIKVSSTPGSYASFVSAVECGMWFVFDTHTVGYCLTLLCYRKCPCNASICTVQYAVAEASFLPY